MIRWLVGRYPADWRRRYGDELMELVERTGTHRSTVLDLARGALLEHRRALQAHLQEGIAMKANPAWRHPTAWAAAAALVLAPTLLFVTASVLAYDLALPGLATALNPIMASIDAWRPADLYLVLAPGIAALLAALPLLRIEVKAGEVLVAVRSRASNLVVTALAVGVGGMLVAHIVSEALAGR